jgi:hypothetical protein
VVTEDAVEAVERITGFLDHMFTADGEGDVIRAYSSGGVQYLLTEGDLRAVLAGYKAKGDRLAQLAPREVVCPVCKEPRKLTATGLIRYHGPHNRPCRASGTPPEAWLTRAELMALNEEDQR